MNRLNKAIFFVLSLPVIVHPQDQNINFEHLSVEQGLSHTLVYCIFQDSKGYMWFGTEDGLNKFDGYQFIVYRHDPADSSSLSNNLIRDMYEDQDGNLWIATIGGGINRFNYETEEFMRFMKDPENPKSIPSNYINRIDGFRYGKKELLWLGTGLGLVEYDPITEEFTLLSHTHLFYPHSYIQAMAVDTSGKVWIGSRVDGLHRFDPITGQYTNFRHNPDVPFSISDNRIISLCWDKSGILWIGVESGLIKYDPRSNRFMSIQMDPNDQHATTGNWIMSIYEDRSDNLWVGTAYDGIKIFDRQTEKFTTYHHNPGDPYSINDNTVMCIFQDKADVLWIGTWEGVNKLDPRKTQLVTINHDPGDSNTLSGNYIWSICNSNYEGKQHLWIGTKTDGLNKFDLINNKIKRYKHEPGNLNSIPSNFISALCEDNSGKLWIGTYGDGLIKYDPQLNLYIRYEHNPEDKESISGNIINCIIEDSSGRLWIGTNFHGLNLFDRKTKKFNCVLKKKDITNIFEDRSGNLWVLGGNIGLKKLDHKTGKFTTYLNNPQEPSSIINNYGHALHETVENGQPVFWIGTNERGLIRFDYKSVKFKTYTISDGLPSNTINGILEDKVGNLWLSTNNGLSRFDPQSDSFRNFDVADGLPGNKFNARVYSKTRDGQLFFGGTNGLVAFYPDRIKENRHIPEIVITDFRVFNKPVGIRKNIMASDTEQYLLNKSISETQEIIISYRENVFSLEFAALDFSAPNKNMYAYKMEDVDPDWVYTDASRRFATYTNLDPGEYIFTVRGSNNDGLWNEVGTSIRIIITPPWWKTNLAYVLYFLLIVSIVITTWHVQLKRIRLKQQLKMEHFEAEKLREVDHLKSRFFANISHEFRTPLTLIKGPVKQIMEGEFVGNLKGQCQMILRNSDRLLGLINQILDLSKLESGEMKLQVSKTDIVHYLKGLILSFSPLAERKKNTLKFEVSENSLVGYIDRDKFDKIINNLISNAFKFTPENGEIILNVIPAKAGIQNNKWIPHQVRDDNNTRLTMPNDQIQMPNKFPIPNSQFQISISNTGPGIPADQIDKIFDRFYQADSTYKKDGEGSGIGLALTKELVEACHGEITVSSTPNETTTFTVTLPISKEYFKEDEIIEESATSIPDTGSRIPDARDRVPETADHKNGIPDQTSHISNPASRIAHPESSILLVEDNPDVTAYISSFLDHQYSIMSAENGKEGLKKVLDKYPDLIISDVMMPEMDGFEFCQKVKSDERISHIPVILLTAKADLDSKIEGLEFGADDYVTKPFEARELQIRVKNLIEQRTKLREKFSALVDLNPADIAASSMDEQLLNRLLAVFEDHMEEPDFSIEQLAREIGMSRSHLNRKIQALTNVSTSEFIRTLRLQRAARLLSNASGTVSEIAYKVGFNNLSYFSKTFRKHFGKLPSELNKKE